MRIICVHSCMGGWGCCVCARRFNFIHAYWKTFVGIILSWMSYEHQNCMWGLIVAHCIIFAGEQHKFIPKRWIHKSYSYSLWLSSHTMFNGGARYYIECCSDEEEHFKNSILSLLFLFYFIIFFFCFVLFILLASIFVCVGFFTSDAQTSMALWNFELWYLQQICCSVLYLDEIYVTQIEEFCLCSVCFDFFFLILFWT